MSYDRQTKLEAAMRYGVLGPVEAKDNHESVVAVGGPQQRRLLAVLLSQPGRSVSSQRLVDCLWPDGLPPDGAGRAVMTYVSRLRSVLGEGSISTVEEGYRFDLNGSMLDARQFESLLSDAGSAEPGRAVDLYDRALALWRGQAYGEFGSEWWLLPEASRLNELRVVAMEEQAEALLALGNHNRAIPELSRLTADQPLRERPVSLLMQALFATGRHADAVREFQSFRSRLGEETGLEPSPELRELERSVVAGQLSPQPGARARLLRGYVVHEVLGEGAFGRVFAATQPGTNREVAIKAIRPELADRAEFIQRFEAEAQLVSRLEHPHIVPLHDYWREPGGAYLVFRLLRGGTAFGAVIQDGPFSVARVSRLVEEVGGALLAAHTAGVVHCDVKPSNVLFDESGNAYLSDFGIAVASSIFDCDGERTRVYAAPELDGRSGDTIQSDIFSFGCMLWELLVGTSPLADMHAMSRYRLPSLAGLISEPCEALDAVLSRATAADLEARYESMADLIVAWRDAVGRPEGVLTPVTPTARSSPDSSRRRAVRALSIAASSAVNPYKGLRPFAEADAADFFGRAQIASALHDTVIAREVVTIVGPSGSGKSSLVHAGLVPLLRREGFRIATMTPGDRPVTALRQALRQVAATDVRPDDIDALFGEAVAEGPGQMVLIVDQFEECWTLAGEGERERFLSTLVMAGRHGVRCVATVRADLYDRPLQSALIGQKVADGAFTLPPLGPQALEEAIVRPAQRNGVDFEDGVVTAVVAEAISQPAGLPLLQFVMAELYERRIDNRVTLSVLNELGGLGGAIGRRAEEIYLSLDDDVQAHTRQLFGRLVAPGQGAPDTRRRARVGELSEPARVAADLFVHARLLVADRDLATREPVIEVGHEALLTSWPRLREWLETDRRWLAQLQHLATATRGWDDAGRPDGELYRGSRLEAVLEELPERGQHLSVNERSFIEASRAARDAVRERDRRSARRLRRVLTVTACLLAVALVAGLIAYTQRQQARSAQRDAEIAALVGRSSSIRSSQRETAALLAIEAFRFADTPRTRSALFSTFTSDLGVLGAHRSPESLGGVTEGIVMPDGKTTLIMGTDQRLRSYDLDSGAIGEPWTKLTEFPGPGSSGLFGSADGRFVAQRFWLDEHSDVTILGVFDTTTHQPVIGPINLPMFSDNVLFSPDDKRVYASGGRDGDVIAYSLTDGTEVARLSGLTAPDDSGLRATTAGLAFVTGGLLAIGSVAGPVRLVDPLTLQVKRQFDAPRGTTEKLVAIENGTTLIGEGVLGRARFDLDNESAGPVWEEGTADQTSSDCEAFTVAEALGRYYCGDLFGRLQERALSNGALIREFRHEHGNPGTIWLAKDGTELVSFGPEPVVSRWRLDGSGPITRRIAEGHSPYKYSPDGQLLLADFGVTPISDPTGWGVLDPASGRVVADSTGKDIQFPDWRADGTLLGVTNIETKPSFSKFDIGSGEVDSTAVTLPRMYDDGFVSEHRIWLYFADGDDHNGPGSIWTIDTDTNTRIEPTIHVDSFVTGSASDSGDRIAIGTLDNEVVVYDGATGKKLHTFSDASRNVSIVGGNRLAIAGGTNGSAFTLYDLDTYQPLTTLGGTRGFGSVVGTADGSIAAIVGFDRSITLYDLASGEQIGDTLVSPDDETVSVALRPDGKELAYGGGAGQPFTVWDLDPEHWVTAACQVAGRNLSRQEWDTNIGDLSPYHKTCPEYD